MDPMSLLESRTASSIDGKEIDAWIEKTNALERTVRGIADGTLDADKVSLKKYGILTPDEEKEVNERRERVRDELRRKQDEERRIEKEREKAKWWEGAVHLYGDGSHEGQSNEDSSKENAVTDAEQRQKLIDRYSSDYQRWSDSSYLPDDEATKEEMALAERQQEEKQNDEFEKANQEWCDQFKADMEKRERMREQRTDEATRLRAKGNRLYKKGEIQKALGAYAEALRQTPYEVKILTNMALCHAKLRNYDDSVEYCNRVHRVDRTCVKALFQRAMAYSELEQTEKALKDLERCHQIDPSNEDVARKFKSLSRKVTDDAIEKRVEQLSRSDAPNERSDARDGPEQTHANTTSAPLSDAEAGNLLQRIATAIFAASDQNDDNDSTLRNQFVAADYILKKLETHGYGSKLPKPETSMVPSSQGPTLAHLLCALLHRSQTLRVYMRSSGHLSRLCQEATCERRSPDDTRIIFEIMKEAVEGESRSTDVLAKGGLVQVAMQTLLSSSSNKEHLFAGIAACGLLSTVLRSPGEEKKRVLCIIFDEGNLLFSITGLLDCLRRNRATQVENNQWVGVMICCRLLSDLVTCKVKGTRLKVQKQLCNPEKRPLVEALSRALTIPFDSSKSEVECIQGRDARQCIVTAIMDLSAYDEIRPSFALKFVSSDAETSEKTSSTAVRTLLAIARSHKSETESTRAAALIALANAIPATAKDGPVKEELCECGGVPLLLSLCCTGANDTSSAVVKQYAAGLLTRCASSIDQGDVKRLAIAYSCTVLDDKWFASQAAEYNSGAQAAFATNLILIVAAANGSGLGGKGCISSLVRMLPTPRLVRGVVTAESVCQPPEMPVQNSAHAIATGSPSFHCNVLKALINFIDSDLSRRDEVLAEGGMERIVCLLANSSRLHPSIVKNAATALAKLVQSRDSNAMKQCRELRGMEILMDLDKAGKI